MHSSSGSELIARAFCRLDQRPIAGNDGLGSLRPGGATVTGDLDDGGGGGGET